MPLVLAVRVCPWFGAVTPIVGAPTGASLTLRMGLVATEVTVSEKPPLSVKDTVTRNLWLTKASVRVNPAVVAWGILLQVVPSEDCCHWKV